MASQYPEGFEPIEAATYPEGFEPIPSPSAQPSPAPSAAVGRLAPSRLTPTQLGALQVGIGPLASLIGSQLRGRPVTQVEAAAEAGLEETARLPGQIGELALRAAPPQVKILSSILEAQDLIPKGSLDKLIKNLTSPVIQAPERIEEFLGVERGPERAIFREPYAAAAGEFGTVFVNPVATESKAGQALAKTASAAGEALLPKATTENAARLVRSALKPSNSQVGKRLENAATQSLDDIFISNPNADKAGEMAIEGFANEVSKLRRSVGQEIGSITAQQKAPISTGEDIAVALNKKADQLAKAGQPESVVNSLRSRANDFAGKEMQISDIQEATTIANRQNSGLFKRTREMANPLLADVDTMANQIISEVGGKGINTVLENLAGPRGAELRKKWSNLRTIEDQAENRLNKLINSAPPESQGAIASALTSLEGLGGLVALGSGLKSGIIPVVGAIAKKWAKTSEKALRDSNQQIKRVYDQFRKNPPKEKPPASPVQRTLSPEEIPPTLQEALSESIARSVRGQAPNLPSSPTQGPILGSTPMGPVSPIATPGFAPPSAQNLQAFLQNMLDQQVASGAVQREAAQTLNQRIAQAIAPQARSSLPSGPVVGPVLGAAPMSPPASMSIPGFTPPVTQEALIQLLMQENEALKAAQYGASTMGVF